MRFPVLLAVGVAAVITPNPAAAQYEPVDFSTGNGLYAACTSDEPVSGMECLRWLEGFDEGMATMALEQGRLAKIEASRLYLYCKPAKVTFGQMMAVVVKFMDDAPQSRHLPSNAITLTALQRAFPCKRPSN